MIKTDIALSIKYSNEDIKSAICERLPVSKDEIKEVRILKRELNLTDKNRICYKMTVGISLDKEREAGLLKMRKKVSLYEEEVFLSPKSYLESRPVVVGSGPAGLFAALVLAESGAKPIILERGLPVEERKAKVDAFMRFSVLDTECNIQFGEGGAGTYSDGKLKVGSPDKYKNKVLNEFVEAGAEEEILYSKTAHLGTDKLSGIVKKLREKIISLGGEFRFSARLTDIKTKNGRVSSAVFIQKGVECEIPTEKILLATGHSAEDVFYLLEALGVKMTAKGFGIGVRIEHPREYIDSLVYGSNPPDGIETASYRLVTHLKNGRSVYSFCMCPGGTVVPATSIESAIVTNGMSEYLRDGNNSNAAFLVSVTPDDFNDRSPLSGISFQRRLEKRAFSLTSSYKAPAVRMDSFTDKISSKSFGSVIPTYPQGTEFFAPEDYLPDFICDSLREAIEDFDKWMPGFKYSDAVLTGPETRSTSPVRVERGENYSSVSIEGLYPCGEGAGYSGGIVSSAVDGIKTAEAVLKGC